VSIRLGLVVGLLVAIAVTYLASINPGRTHLVLGGDWALDVPLMALVVGAVGVGAALALVLGWLRDLVRGRAEVPRAPAAPIMARPPVESVHPAAPAPARVASSIVPRRRSSIRARPSTASARSIRRAAGSVVSASKTALR